MDLQNKIQKQNLKISDSVKFTFPYFLFHVETRQTPLLVLDMVFKQNHKMVTAQKEAIWQIKSMQGRVQ